MRARAPLDLADGRLRKLAAALSPVYVRVSDTWANTLYFQDTDDSVARPAPAGFGAVLTRPQWKSVIDFFNALDARIVTSFSIGTGVRDASAVWAPSEAKKLLAYTSRAGGRIAAVEFLNEPNMAGSKARRKAMTPHNMVGTFEYSDRSSARRRHRCCC